VTWLIHIYGMARVCTLVALVYQGDLSQQVTYLLYASFNTCNMTHSYMWHDSFRMCDMTYWYLWNGACVQTRSARLSSRPFAAGDLFLLHDWINMCDITQSYVWHDSSIFVTWLIRMCDMTHSYLWHDACAQTRCHVSNSLRSSIKETSTMETLNESCHTHSARIWMSHGTLTALVHDSHDSFKVPWPIQGAMTQSYMTHSRCHDSFWHDSFKVPWLIHIRALRVWHDSVTWLILSGKPWMSHVTLPALVYEWIMAHSQRSYMSHVTHSIMETLNESCHTHSACLWMSHIPLTALVYQGDTSQRVTCCIRMCDITHSYVCHTCAMTRVSGLPALVWRDDLLGEMTWLIHICDITHSYVWHDSFVRTNRTCLLRRPLARGDMTHSHLWHDSSIRGTWLVCAN